jgi:Tol biopolymer transport system component
MMRALLTITALAAATLVTSVSAQADGRRSPANGRIAYSVGAVLPDPDPSAHSQVFTIRPDGSGRRQLTHVAAPAQAGDPNYSPDAARIAYVSSVGGTFQVWLMRADGSNQHRLVRDPGHDAFVPSWAPDGKHLIFTRCTRPFGFVECTIARVRSDGTHLRDITGGHWVDFSARYAPDGRSIAFSSNRRGLISAIWRMRSDGSRMRRLTAPRPEAFWPAYSPDGNTILFGNNFDRPHTDLFTTRRDGSHVRQLTHFGPKTQGGFASYSPDGRRIVSDYAPNGGTEGLAIMNSDGTGLHRIVRTGNLTIADWGVQR